MDHASMGRAERLRRIRGERRAAEEWRRTRLLPTWIEWFFVVGAAVLIPWTVFLFTTNEPGVISKHSRLVWGGFDCFLVIGFALTAYRVARRSPRGAITATATGTMLFIDAWFDVLTSRRASEQLIAVLLALFAEIPCAVICFHVAHKIIGLFEASIPVLREAGFRLSGGRLTPPPAELGAAAPSVAVPPVVVPPVAGELSES